MGTAMYSSLISFLGGAASPTALHQPGYITCSKVRRFCPPPHDRLAFVAATPLWHLRSSAHYYDAGTLAHVPGGLFYVPGGLFSERLCSQAPQGVARDLQSNLHRSPTA